MIRRAIRRYLLDFADRIDHEHAGEWEPGTIHAEYQRLAANLRTLASEL